MCRGVLGLIMCKTLELRNIIITAHDNNRFCHRCDGHDHCGDGSDERGCSVTCGPTDFQCPATKQCIPDAWLCDGDADCLNREDENNCAGAQDSIPSN